MLVLRVHADEDDAARRGALVVARPRAWAGSAAAAADGVWWWRDQVTSGWDDSGQLDWLKDQQCAFVRGEAHVARPGVVEVDGQELEYDRLVVATGSRPRCRRSRGSRSVEYWTNVEATSSHEVPESLAVMGGGPVGAELAQFFARLGSASP